MDRKLIEFIINSNKQGYNLELWCKAEYDTNDKFIGMKNYIIERTGIEALSDNDRLLFARKNKKHFCLLYFTDICSEEDKFYWDKIIENHPDEDEDYDINKEYPRPDRKKCNELFIDSMLEYAEKREQFFINKYL